MTVLTTADIRTLLKSTEKSKWKKMNVSACRKIEIKFSRNAENAES